MTYMRKQIDSTDETHARENLSTRVDARVSEADASQGRILPVPQCDFCADAVPCYIYAAERMSTGEARRCWRWMACTKCARMIEHGNWDALNRRVVARFKKFFAAKYEAQFRGKVTDGMIHEAVTESLQQFHNYVVRVPDATT